MTAQEINTELGGMYEENDRLIREVEMKMKEREMEGLRTMTGLKMTAGPKGFAATGTGLGATGVGFGATGKSFKQGKSTNKIPKPKSKSK